MRMLQNSGNINVKEYDKGPIKQISARFVTLKGCTWMKVEISARPPEEQCQPTRYLDVEKRPKCTTTCVQTIPSSLPCLERIKTAAPYSTVLEGTWKHFNMEWLHVQLCLCRACLPCQWDLSLMPLHPSPSQHPLIAPLLR